MVAGVVGGSVILIAIFGSGGGSGSPKSSYSGSGVSDGVADMFRLPFQHSLWLLIKIPAASLKGAASKCVAHPNGTGESDVPRVCDCERGVGPR